MLSRSLSACLSSLPSLLAVCAASVLALGTSCGDDGASSAEADATPSNHDAGADAQQEQTFDRCAGDCAQTTLTADFDGDSYAFDRAFFGLSSPAQSSSGEWEIWLEANAGSFAGCPEMLSPNPDFIIIVSGLVSPTEAAVDEAGVVNVVDFSGQLLTDGVNEQSTSDSVTWVAADLCIGCSEGTDDDREDRFVAFDFQASFPSGSVSGHAYATHCPSLDKI